MKKLFTLLICFISITSFANTVIVKGSVKDSSGKGVASRNVRITTDTTVSNANCQIVHYKITDANGFYSDTLTCNSDIKKLRIYTESCGVILINDPQITTTNIVESNFVICTPPPVVIVQPAPPVSCTAYFLFSAQANSVKFSSSATVISSNDTIISRKWEFGDSTTNLTSVDPLHVYAKTGIYNVCFSIKTAKGCESKICKTITLHDTVPPVVVTPPPVTCNAYFVFVPQIAGVKFNSNVSVISPTDTIVSRKWFFGDGDSSLANQVDPSHIYTKMGSYNVCLSIKTAKGCESKICKTVVLGDSLSPIAGSVNEPVKIVRVYPNPVHEKLNMLVWSFNNNIAAEISIVDVYGQKKWSKKISLLKGNNSMDVNVSFLVSGPYFFKVNTAFGAVGYKFYKL
ncbi:MAG: T9SS type A sorting domain-containing protein [Deinococcales bacterium]|nr:T9SS type A sorting domain-containing protein [Chitinophagaceae bacterium]